MKVKSVLLSKEYKGYTFPIECSFKSDVKNINARIKDNKIVISAPYHLSLNRVQQFINTLPNRFLDRVIINIDHKKDENDGYVFLLGKRRKCTNILDNPSEDDITYRNDADLKRKIKSFALGIFTNEVRKYEKIMGVNKEYKVAVREMRTRHGTNSRKTYTIALNLNLIHYNIDVIDSVVIHELAHHYEFNHSSKFYDIVYKYCPNYDKLSAILRKGEYQ